VSVQNLIVRRHSTRCTVITTQCYN